MSSTPAPIGHTATGAVAFARRAQNLRCAGNAAGDPLFAGKVKVTCDAAADWFETAAPELLEALKWFIDDIDSTHTVMLDFDANVERARAAIRKATEQSS